MNDTTENYLNFLIQPNTYIIEQKKININETIIIEYIDNLLLESSWTKEGLIHAYKNNISVVEKYLKKYGVDIDYIKSEGEKAVKFISTQQKKGISITDTAKVLVKNIEKRITTRMIDTRKIKTNLTDTIIKSIGIFTIVLYTNTWLHGLAITTFALSPAAGMLFIGCIIAPLVEEYAKRFAILGNYPFIYTGLFAGVEGIMYVMRMTSMGISLSSAIIVRIMPFFMHMGTMMVQKYYHEKAIEEDNEIKSRMGYFIGVALHSLWNYRALQYVIKAAEEASKHS